MRNFSMKKFGMPIGAAPGWASEKPGLSSVGEPSALRPAGAAGPAARSRAPPGRRSGAAWAEASRLRFLTGTATALESRSRLVCCSDWFPPPGAFVPAAPGAGAGASPAAACGVAVLVGAGHGVAVLVGAGHGV